MRSISLSRKITSGQRSVTACFRGWNGKNWISAVILAGQIFIDILVKSIYISVKSMSQL